MNIGIDIRYLSRRLLGGIHTYLRCIVPEILKQAPDHTFFLYADTKAPVELDRAPLPDNARLQLQPYRNALSFVAGDVGLWRRLMRDKVDVSHFPANYGFASGQTRTVVTLHDALTLEPVSTYARSSGSQVHLRGLLLTLYLHYFSMLAARRADIVITLSEFSRREILRVADIDASRVIVIPHGAPEDMHRIDDLAVRTQMRTRLQLPARYILADALKNPETVVSAWRNLPATLRTECPIVFFCRHADPLPIVLETVACGDAALLVRPNRVDLQALYSLADLFFFPSWTEGFGLPLLEAMACGAPVIASSRGAIPEVVGNAGLIADVDDTDTFTRHLLRILGNASVADHFRLLGYQRASAFQWSRSAEQTLAVYLDVAQKVPRGWRNPGVSGDSDAPLTADRK